MIFLACGDRQTVEIAPIDTTQFAYFPLKIGKFVVYQVDSIVYDFGPGGQVVQDSSRTFSKEIVTDTLRDNSGELQYIIDRYERTELGQPWVFKNAITASQTGTQAVRTENNWRFLKLVFPMDRRSEWDGNIWIDESREIEIAGERMRPFTNWAYEVDSIDVQAIVGQLSFDSTLLITEADDTNVIERRLSRVRYAKHVGVVWREQWILDSQYCNQLPPPADCETRPWAQKAEKGYILRQTIISFN
ncbi:MAG: hypothetical protein ACKVU0_00365 [Saprospiraceae bacterium]